MVWGGETNTADAAGPVAAPAVREEYNEIFAVEIDCWCYGFLKFPGEISAPLVHRVLKELAPVLQAAIDHNYVFDAPETARLIGNATGYVVSEKEICFSLLAQLPLPQVLTEDAQFILAQVVDKAEQVYPGVHERMEQRWRTHRKDLPAAEQRVLRKRG
jgi:hypothetical protein